MLSSFVLMFRFMYRIGFSEDIHPIKKGRKLFLGGLFFPEVDGLDGHSDADVVLHAVGESILGALALGDLGKYFPDTDEKYKDIDSKIIVSEICKIMIENHYKINNIDVQIACSTVKLSTYIDKMRGVISSLLNTDINNVSIKAMSFNKIGPIGEGKAIKASSIVLLEKI